MTTIEIKKRVTGVVLWSGEAESLRDAVLEDLRRCAAEDPIP
jgi:hypothetical protein